MKIIVIGSLREVEFRADICESFVRQMGKEIASRGHILLTGCRNSLDRALAQSAQDFLKSKGSDARKQIISYRPRTVEAAHDCGTIRYSKLQDWELTHPTLVCPEQIATADVAIFIGGHDGTFAAANWARIAGKPVLGVSQFGGAGQAIYDFEQENIIKRQLHSVSAEEYELLNQDTRDVDQFATDILNLAEKIASPNGVFTIMSYLPEYEEIFSVYNEICHQYGFAANRTDTSDVNDRIISRIISETSHSAFVIADISVLSPNVYYELGFAHGLGKQAIVTAKQGTKLPFDISDIPVIFWKNTDDLSKKLKKRVATISKALRKQ